jgi:hypothetical protein
MLSRRLTNVLSAGLRSRRLAAPFVQPVQAMSGNAHWVPSGDEVLQKVTIQSLVHEISLQQMESGE